MATSWRCPLRAAVAGDAGHISRLLAGRVGELVRELLPHGQRDGREWRVGSIAGEKGKSLAVHLTGARSGIWADFSSGERGDALDLVAATLYRGDRRQALTWSRRWLGLDSGSGAVPPVMPAAPPPQDDRGEAEAEERRLAANRIWLGCAPGLADTPVDHYLRARGIVLGELARSPGAIRFHPGLWNKDSGRAWPAMVAAISGAAGGKLTAIHRTWLAKDPASGRWGKAPLQNPKMTLGGYGGGVIRIQRGASDKPLARAPDGEAVVLAEGIETALSVALACPELRVLAGVSLGNIGRIDLPPAIRDVVIAADHDTAEPARRALRAAIARFVTQGRMVRIAMPPTPGADWNDVLRDEAA